MSCSNGSVGTRDRSNGPSGKGPRLRIRATPRNRVRMRGTLDFRVGGHDSPAWIHGRRWVGNALLAGRAELQRLRISLRFDRVAACQHRREVQAAGSSAAGAPRQRVCHATRRFPLGAGRKRWRVPLAGPTGRFTLLPLPRPGAPRLRRHSQPGLARRPEQRAARGIAGHGSAVSGRGIHSPVQSWPDGSPNRVPAVPSSVIPRFSGVNCQR